MKSALDVHQALLGRGVQHEVVRLPGPAAGADDLPRLLGVDRSDCVAVRCYRVEEARTSDGAAVHLAAVAVRAGDVPDDSEVRAALAAAAVRSATPDEVSAHTDFAASLVCPIGLPEDVVLLADAALAARRPDAPTTVYCATGETGTALAVGLRDLLVTSGARVAPLTPTPLLHRGDWRTEGASSGAQVISLQDAMTDRRAEPGGRVGRTSRSTG